MEIKYEIMKTKTPETESAPCSTFTDGQAHFIANQLKHWLENGYAVKATDPENVLVALADGSLHGGMFITTPPRWPWPSLIVT